MIAHITNDISHKAKTLVISHCNCADRVEWVKSQIEQLCKFSKILIVETRGIATVYANKGGIICSY